ncbi:MAG TPA: subclass B3 metallo-beta-lactamase [Blastocatellia bacterium]|nr:subclass B3 metallo-beta-lactamase [Blastocatellia bacterium]
MKYRAIGLAFLSFAVLPVLTADGQYAKETQEWNRPVEPFRIIGNIYYVGASDITSYLIATPAGFIIIDGGFNETVPQIQKNIKKLGFDLKDVKILLNSHAHYDHAGGLATLKFLTGAKMCATRADAVLLEAGGKGDYLFGDRLLFRPVKVDRLLDDGDKVELGGTVLTAHLTPGHTRGNTTWTMTVMENGKRYDVVFAGSTTINPGTKLVGNDKYSTIAEDYAKSFRVLKSLHCDVFLGPHASFYSLEEKRKKLAGGSEPNPFVDPDGYAAFIARTEKVYLDQLTREQQAAQGH